VSPEGATRWPVWVRALVGVFATIGIVYTALMVWVSFGHICSIEESAIVPSPSGAAAGHVSERSCKGDAPITEVTVWRHDPGSSSAMSEVVFKAAANPVEPGAPSTVRVYLTWPADNELQISYPYGLRFESRVQDAVGIKVSYHEVWPRSQ
jgi:hypothetical protein